MTETTVDPVTGATVTDQPYQYGSNNGFASVTAKAKESGTSGITDPEDPAYWETPGLSFTPESNSNYTRYGNITNVVSGTVNSTFTSTLFAPGSITRMFTEDVIDNTTGAATPDTKPDVLGIVGTAPGQPDIQLTLRVKLQKNAVTGVVDMARYTVEATNKSSTQAYAYGISWNVDTYIGKETNGYNGDHAEFQAPGLNRFSVKNVAFRFPNPGITPWAAYLTDPSTYLNSVPKYLYACPPDPANSFTAVIYPLLTGGRDTAYPGVAFEAPDYLGMGDYGTIMTESCVPYYYWHTYTGLGPVRNNGDSGHIVRYNPRLLLPGQSLYFGVDYGQGVVGQAADSDPYLQVDMWATPFRQRPEDGL
jgi:hypothetical protein